MKKSTFVYYVSVKEMYGDNYISDFLERKKYEIFEQLNVQFKEEFDLNIIGFVMIPITSGIERIELIQVTF